MSVATAIIGGTVLNCCQCTKKVSCKGTQPVTITWSAIYIEGDPCGGNSTGCARCSPGSSGSVRYEMRPTFNYGQATSTGEGCGICKGCPEDYLAKKQALINSHPPEEKNVTYTWQSTNGGCPASCPNNCYRPKWTRPTKPKQNKTLTWGCGPCDKVIPCPPGECQQQQNIKKK